MVNDTTQSRLLGNLFAVLEAHRPAFKQERPFMRAVGLVLGEIFSFGRHTVTRGLLSLGITDGDWGHGTGYSAGNDLMRRNFQIVYCKRHWSTW